MSTQSSPTLRRRRLARKLRALREEAGLSLEEAAPKLDKTRSALGRIEGATTGADVHLVRSMMDLYDVYDPELLDLARQAMRPGWWQAFGIRDRGFIGLETEALASLELSLMYVPGLLQTEDYIRALFATGKIKRTKKELENQISVRLIRQRRLVDEQEPLTLVAIMDEAALHRAMGSVEMMRAQLRRLIEATELDTVTLQVLPNVNGPHVGMDGAFTLLQFTDPEDPDLLYVAYVTGALHVEKPQETAEAKLIFDNLRSAALSPVDSVALIERLGSELYSL